jgi:hypothetical protein
MNELLTLLAGFILTLAIYSYLVRDNPLYRLAIHLLVGVAAGYAVVVAVQSAILPVARQIQADPAGAGALWLAPILLALLLLLRVVLPRTWLSNSSLALLVGVGAAVGLVGAVLGTLVPLAVGVRSDNRLIGLLAALLTICALTYFHFTGRLNADGVVVMPVWRRYPAFVGKIVLTVTFAALFAGALNTSIVLLSERIGFFIDGFTRVLGTLFS